MSRINPESGERKPEVEPRELIPTEPRSHRWRVRDRVISAASMMAYFAFSVGTASAVNHFLQPDLPFDTRARIIYAAVMGPIALGMGVLGYAKPEFGYGNIYGIRDYIVRPLGRALGRLPRISSVVSI